MSETVRLSSKPDRFIRAERAVFSRFTRFRRFELVTQSDSARLSVLNLQFVKA